MNIRRGVPILLAVCVAAASPCRPETDPGPEDGLPGVSRVPGAAGRVRERVHDPEPFILVISRHFEQDALLLQQLRDRGYGRNELIALLLIADRAGIPADDVIAERDRKRRLGDIARRHGVCYREVMSETLRTRRLLDRQFLEYPETHGTVRRSTGSISETRERERTDE